MRKSNKKKSTTYVQVVKSIKKVVLPELRGKYGDIVRHEMTKDVEQVKLIIHKRETRDKVGLTAGERMEKHLHKEAIDRKSVSANKAYQKRVRQKH